jgi:hypothetical protein
VSKEEGEELAREKDMLFMEGSALTGGNLDNCMRIVADRLFEWLERIEKLEEINKISLKSSVVGGKSKSSSNCW